MSVIFLDNNYVANAGEQTGVTLPLYHSTGSFNRLLFGNNEGLREERGWVGNIVRELPMMQSTYLMKRLITPNHVLLQGSRLYTLISIFPDANP